jgi:hypothetical protein
MSTDSPAPKWRDVLPLHDACKAGRPLGEAELREIGEDILANGLHNPIALFREQRPDGGGYASMLLDGQNRLDALESIGLCISVTSKRDRTIISISGPGFDQDRELKGITRGELQIESYYASSSDPWKVAASLNLHRRHDDAKQRADHAANLRERVAILAKIERKGVGRPSKENRQSVGHGGALRRWRRCGWRRRWRGLGLSAWLGDLGSGADRHLALVDLVDEIG